MTITKTLRNGLVAILAAASMLGAGCASIPKVLDNDAVYREMDICIASFFQGMDRVKTKSDYRMHVEQVVQCLDKIPCGEGCNQREYIQGARSRFLDSCRYFIEQ